VLLEIDMTASNNQMRNLCTVVSLVTQYTTEKQQVYHIRFNTYVANYKENVLKLKGSPQKSIAEKYMQKDRNRM